MEDLISIYKKIVMNVDIANSTWLVREGREREGERREIYGEGGKIEGERERKMESERVSE